MGERRGEGEHCDNGECDGSHGCLLSAEHAFVLAGEVELQGAKDGSRAVCIPAALPPPPTAAHRCAAHKTKVKSCRVRENARRTTAHRDRLRASGVALVRAQSELRKSSRNARDTGSSASNVSPVSAPWPLCAVIASLMVKARPSWRKRVCARKPQSGCVRIRRPVASFCVMPSPRLPMSCSRKSEKGWKSTWSSAAIGLAPVVKVLVWHWAQPIASKTVSPAIWLGPTGPRGGGARSCMKSVK